MADIELVIKIPEKDYINTKNAINSLIENGCERASMSKICLAILDGVPLPEYRETSKTNIDITDDEKIADWLARLRSDLEVFGFPRYRDTYQRTLDIAIKRFMESAYPNSNVDVMAWKEVNDGRC